MRYKFTQLKELSNSAKGTEYSCLGIREHYIKDKGFVNCYEISYKKNPNQRNYYIEYVPVGETVLDKPEWFKREIDYNNLDNLQCPKCGGFYYQISAHFQNYNKHCIITLECPCGYIRKLEWQF